MSRCQFAPGILAGVLLIALGCDSGPKLTEVTGTVKMNGKPLDKIQVEFWPEVKGPRSIGETDGEGRFTLTTHDGKQKGAVVGPHKIILRDTGMLGDKFLGRKAEGVDMSQGRKSRIPAKYTDSKNTPLSREVTSGQNNIDLEVIP